MPKPDEQIPSLLVAASFGGEMDSESGSPNASKGVKDLRRKFEDNEADIITDLYARHFKPQEDTIPGQGSCDSQEVPLDKTTVVSGGKVELGPNDSIGQPDYETVYGQGYFMVLDDDKITA